MSRLLIIISLYLLGTIFVKCDDNTTTTAAPIIRFPECNLKKSSPEERALLEQIRPLQNSRFTWEDEEHKYYLGVCTRAETSNEVDEALVQVNKKNQNRFVLGRLNDVDLEGSRGWVRMNLRGGDPYKNACGRAQRSAVVLLLCNSNNSSDVFEMIEENTEREENCAYVFQLLSPKMCAPDQVKCNDSASSNSTKSPSEKKGFPFTILLIVFCALFTVYFVMGTVYKRYVNEERGIDQLPHAPLWRAIGGTFSNCFGRRSASNRRYPYEYEPANDRASEDEDLLIG